LLLPVAAVEPAEPADPDAGRVRFPDGHRRHPAAHDGRPQASGRRRRLALPIGSLLPRVRR